MMRTARSAAALIKQLIREIRRRKGAASCDAFARREHSETPTRFCVPRRDFFSTDSTAAAASSSSSISMSADDAGCDFVPSRC